MSDEVSILVLLRVSNNGDDASIDDNGGYRLFRLPPGTSTSVSLATVKRHCRAILRDLNPFVGPEGYHWRVRVDEDDVDGEDAYFWWDVRDETEVLPVLFLTEREVEGILRPRTDRPQPSDASFSDEHEEGNDAAAGGASPMRALGKLMHKMADSFDGATTAVAARVRDGPRVPVIVLKLLDLGRADDVLAARKLKEKCSRYQHRAVPSRDANVEQELASSDSRSDLDTDTQDLESSESQSDIETELPPASHSVHWKEPIASKNPQEPTLIDLSDFTGLDHNHNGNEKACLFPKPATDDQVKPSQEIQRPNEKTCPLPKPTVDDQIKVLQENALQELRDRRLQDQKREAEEEKLRTRLEPKIKAWSEEHGRKKQLRSLLASLHEILWAEANWRQIGLGDLLEERKCTVWYRKATLRVHPDKTLHLDAEKRFLAKRIFDALAQAKAEFDLECSR
eukprot:CAMPEP_0197449482 /NCGR_PEP_ID=MMETSP1175-20131217/21711_1 /TAXON_ID=1003142 /ORGANISM="Triceratium dubium, Strain CCMP147" /LENGTH=452 /DNA_ID=CAMNT_0042981627 /DNA_START=129 /DNA_END=1487 /DNA_ORIENTATION=+